MPPILSPLTLTPRHLAAAPLPAGPRARPAGASAPPVLQTPRPSGQLSLPFFPPGSRRG